MTLPYPKNKLEFIQWYDAVADSNRCTEETLEQMELVTNGNIGWVLHENEKRVVLIHGVSETSERDFILIPVNAIISRIHLFPKTKRKNNEEVKGKSD